MAAPLTARQEAEAVEQFGDDLAKLIKTFDRLCERMSSEALQRIGDVAGHDLLTDIARDFQALGDAMCREDDAREGAI